MPTRLRRSLIATSAALAGLAATLPAAASDAPPAVPEPPVLGPVVRLPEALRLLRERGLDLLQAEAAVRGAAGDLNVAGAVANPGFSLSYGRSFTYGTCTDAAGNPTGCGVLPDPAWAVSLSDSGALVDWLSGKRGLRVATARAALEAARGSRDEARRALEGQVRQAFTQAVVSSEAVRFAGEVAASSARTLQLTQARYDAGAISEADLARIQVAQLEAEQARTSALQVARAAKIALAFLLGVRGPVPDFEVEGPELLRAPPARVDGTTRQGLLDRAQASRPDLAAARRQRERAEAALALARRLRFPDVQVSVAYTQQGTTSSSIVPPTLTAGVSLPLPIFHQQQGEIARAEADLSAQSLAAAKVEAQVVSDVESAWSDVQATTALVHRMEGGLLERATRARDLVEVQYRKGAASLLDYLDAQRTFIATRVEYLNDLAACWAATFRLEQAAGEAPP